MKQFLDNFIDIFILEDTFTTFYGRDHYDRMWRSGF